MHRIAVEYGTPTDPDRFEKHYAEVHIALVSALPGLRRFTTSHPRGLGTQAPYLVAELWFDDARALGTALTSAQMATAAADAQAFDVRSTTMFAGEVVETAL